MAMLPELGAGVICLTARDAIDAASHAADAHTPASPNSTAASLPPLVAAVRASSVLKRNVKAFGPAHVLDGSPDSCWNSDSGVGQWIELTFTRPVALHHVVLTFQGGFVAQGLEIRVSTMAAGDGEDAWACLREVDPEDTNAPQTFECAAAGVLRLRLLCARSTDFYGRVTLYSLQAYGSVE